MKTRIVIVAAIALTSATLHGGQVKAPGSGKVAPLPVATQRQLIDQYCVTMERLRALPVTVVHAGHDPSFGPDRLRQLTTTYLQRRRC